MDKYALSEEFVSERKQITGRECGTCSLCCKLLDVPEAGKPQHDWCPHCRPGKGGCSIYNTRPSVCRGYACQWLVTDLGDEWYPQRSKIVVDFHQHTHESGHESTIMRFHVDPQWPNQWRKEPYFSQIKQMARQGLEDKDETLRFQTVISNMGRWTIVLPDGSTHKFEPGVTVPLPLPDGSIDWKFIRCKSDKAVLAMDEMMKLLQKIGPPLHQQYPHLHPMQLLEMAMQHPDIEAMIQRHSRELGNSSS